jgi:hypothetical protein
MVKTRRAARFNCKTYTRDLLAIMKKKNPRRTMKDVHRRLLAVKASMASADSKF